MAEQIEILTSGALQVKEISTCPTCGAQSNNRSVLSPGADLSGRSKLVTDIATVVWTEDVIEAYQANLAAQQLLVAGTVDAG